MRRLHTLCALFSLLVMAMPASGQLREQVSTRAERWPVKTREFVDLWFHGFALLTDDSARVPLFRHGYRDGVTVDKNRRGLVTDFDANADELRAQLVARPSLAQAQFAVLAFESDVEMDRAFAAFLSANGDPRKAPDRQTAQMVSYLAGYFPLAEDRDWARKFTNGLKSERERFFHDWWLDEQRRRAGALAAGDSLWQLVLRPSVSRFLNSTKQAGGSLLFSLPLEGEGRTASFGERQNVIAVPLPDSAGDAVEALYVTAHELVGAVTAAVIEDNLSPAQKRAGAGERLSAIALVRGGLMLLQKAAPQMADGYARFYLRVAQVRYEGDPLPALERAFPLSTELADSMRRQIGLAFGGI